MIIKTKISSSLPLWKKGLTLSLAGDKQQQLCHSNPKLFSTSVTRGQAPSKDNEWNEETGFIFESKNGKSLITINRPKVMNSIRFWSCGPLLQSLEEAEANNSMIIIRGQGDKAFSAGADISGLLQLQKSHTGGKKNVFTRFKAGNRAFVKIHTMGIPYIALMNGITMGGGLALSNLGRYRVANENTLCSMPETAIGIHPNCGSVYFLPRLRIRNPPTNWDSESGRKFGLFLFLTGHRLKGSDTYGAGIATHMCSSGMMGDLQEELIGMDNSKAKDPKEIEKILQYYTDKCEDSRKPLSLQENLQGINKIFSANSMEGIVSNLEKDSSDFSKSVLETLGKMSPTSLKISLKFYETCRGLSLSHCLMLDSRVDQHCFQGPDFREGVRALIIDKDRRPKWSPSKLEDVSDAYVDTFFKPIEGEEELRMED